MTEVGDEVLASTDYYYDLEVLTLFLYLCLLEYQVLNHHYTVLRIE
jgi:hypothetical protein